MFPRSVVGLAVLPSKIQTILSLFWAVEIKVTGKAKLLSVLLATLKTLFEERKLAWTGPVLWSGFPDGAIIASRLAFASVFSGGTNSLVHENKNALHKNKLIRFRITNNIVFKYRQLYKVLFPNLRNIPIK